MGEVKKKRELKQQEQLILKLMESTPGIFILKDHEGHWLRANKNALDTFQLNGIKYQGMHDSELAEHSNSPEAMIKCVTTDKIAWENENTLHLEEQVGNTYWEVQKQPVYKETYHKHGMIVMSKNITEVKLVEEKLMNDFIRETAKRQFFDMGR